MSRTLKIVLGVIAGFILLFSGIFYLVFALTGGVTKATDSFFTQIAEGNARAAYDNSAEGLKSENSFEEFQGFVEKMQLAAYKDSKWTQRNIENDRGRVQGAVSFTDGEVVLTTVELVKENGVWKVHSIDLNEGGFTDARSEVETTPPSLVEAEELVGNTMRSFALAYEKKYYTEFNKEISEALQEKVAPIGFDEVFKNIKLDSDAIQYLKTGSPAIASDTPFVDENGTLIIDGSYPNTVDFTFKYIPENSQWKLMAIYLD